MPLLKEVQHKKHIIWDWNGTILNDIDHAISTMNDILKTQELPSIGKKRYKEIFTFPVKDYYDTLGFDYSKRSFEDLAHEFVDNYMAGFKDCYPFAKIKNTLEKVKETGKTQSILSATDQESLDEMMEHFDFKDLFKHVFGINDKLAHSKVYRGKELIETSGFDRADTILIGDTLHDKEVAEELGIDVLLVTHGHQCEKILSGAHDRVIDIFNYAPA